MGFWAGIRADSFFPSLIASPTIPIALYTSCSARRAVCSCSSCVIRAYTAMNCGWLYRHRYTVRLLTPTRLATSDMQNPLSSRSIAVA